MRKIDLHCYPATAPWIASQGPYVEALAAYWKKPWVAKDEADVAAELATLEIEAVLVAFDIESVTGTPPCSNAYVAQLRDRYPGQFIAAWGAVDPLKGEQAIRDAEDAVKVHGVIGFHFHPIMGHFRVDDPALRPLFETINRDKVMFGSDHPSMPYERILREWAELGYSDEVMHAVFHANAERVLGLEEVVR